MSKVTEILNLSHLLDQEKEAILAVLQRDENLKKVDDKRVRKLKNELLEIKKKGAKMNLLRQNSGKICVRCQKSLGLIFNRGAICPVCQLRVCKTCRVMVKGAWKCIVCSKITQIRVATGEWFFEERSKRFTSSTVLGTDVVKKSILRKGPVSIKRKEVVPSTDITENTPVPAETVESSGKLTPDKKTGQNLGKGEDGKSIRSNYDTQSLRSNRSLSRANGTTDKKTGQRHGKGEDAKSIGSNYDTQSLRSIRSMSRADGRGKRVGKQERSGEDSISIHSNYDTRSLRSITSIPERRSKTDIYNLPEDSQADFIHTGQDNVDGISQASFQIDSRPESKRNSPASVRGSVLSLNTSGLAGKATGNMNSAQSAIKSNNSKTSTSAIVHQSSPTPSKHSTTSKRCNKHLLVSGMKTSSSIPDNMAKGHQRQVSGTHSLSRVSIASDRSQSELDLSIHSPEEYEETGSIRSRSVPGGLNSDLEHLYENEEDFPETGSYKAGGLSSGLSQTAQPISDRKRTHLSVPDADADTASLTSMTSLYSEAGDYGNVKVTGEIVLNLNYSYKTGALNIMVKSCKNIAVADEKKNKTDPYVKAYLLPDKSRQSKRKTKIKTNTTNPDFNELLKYVISHTQLETRTLQLSVWHNDRFGRNSFLGEVNIPLDTWNFENQEDECFTLQPKMDMTSDVTLQYKGEITVGLRYIPPEKNLTLPLEPVTGKKSFRRSKKVPMPTGAIIEVLVKEAKNLTAVKSGGTSDTFVKGYILPDNKSTKHKTSIIKKSVNPQWNHTFSFTSLQPDDLQNVCLELTVWDKESLSSNIFLGGVSLGCGSGISYGNEVDWMDAQGEEQYLWQKMMDSPGTSVEGTLMLRSSMAKRQKS